MNGLLYPTYPTTVSAEPSVQGLVGDGIATALREPREVLCATVRYARALALPLAFGFSPPSGP